MTTPLWIGFGFAIPLLACLIYILLSDAKKFSYEQTMILRYLLALSGGLTAAFMGGGLLLKIDGKLSEGANYGISATGGLALFIIILYSTKVKNKVLKDSITASTTDGYSFKDNILTLVNKKKTVQFQGFSDEQLSQKIPSKDFSGNNLKEAIESLGRGIVGIPDYKVNETTENIFVEKK